MFDQQVVYFLLVLVVGDNIGDLDEYDFDFVEVELEGEEGFGVAGLDDVVDDALVVGALLVEVYIDLFVVVDILDIVDEQLVDLPVLVLLLIADEVL